MIIDVTDLPGKKKKSLVIGFNGESDMYKIASFDDDEKAIWFDGVLDLAIEKMIYKIKQDARSERDCGEWVEYDGDFHWYYECSECGYRHDRVYDTLPDYCPDCGAKMNKSEE
ncbi:MAG: hypothetical protein J6T96_05410 [Bacteroidales bacterium]|nr:hypothetical protein [Bacteroidales bacterium]